MEPLPDHYAALGLSPDADERDIKKAWRQAAREAHPDLPGNQGNEEAQLRWRRIRVAWEVLSEPASRARYDEQRTWGAARSAGPSHMRDVHDAATARMADVFADLFGFEAERVDPPPRSAPRDNSGPSFRPRHPFAHPEARGPRPFEPGPRPGPSAVPPIKGEDLHLDLEVPFRTACLGGTFATDIRCVSDTGRYVIERLEVRVPPLRGREQNIRVPGRGHAGSGGGPRGDAVVSLRAGTHAHFRAEGDDIVLDVPLTPSEAARGCRVEVPTLDAPATVVVPPGVRSGQKLRVRGQGAIQGPESRGALILVLRVELPPDLDATDLAALLVIEERHRFRPRDRRWDP